MRRRLEISDVRNPGRCFGVDDLAASVFYLVLRMQRVARMLSMLVSESQLPVFGERMFCDLLLQWFIASS